LRRHRNDSTETGLIGSPTRNFLLHLGLRSSTVRGPSIPLASSGVGRAEAHAQRKRLSSDALKLS